MCIIFDQQLLRPLLLSQQVEVVRSFINLSVLMSNIWIFLLHPDSHKFSFSFCLFTLNTGACGKNTLLRSAIYCQGLVWVGYVNFILSYVYYTGGARNKVPVILSHLFLNLPSKATRILIFLYYLFYCFVFFRFLQIFSNVFQHHIHIHWILFPISSFSFYKFEKNLSK